jgi:hypothetical protein
MKKLLIILLIYPLSLIADDSLDKTRLSVDKNTEKRYGKTGEDLELGKTKAAIDPKKEKSWIPEFNPIISANFLVLYDWSENFTFNNGFKIQEVLLQFGATVDKVFEAEVFVGIEQDKQNREEFSIFPVGVFAETRSGEKVNFRAGQFLNHFGEHNSRYKHNFPFILAPLINQELFGERGLNFIGIGVDWKGHLSKHAEITFEFTQGRNAHLFGNDENNYLGTVRLLGKHDFHSGHNLRLGASGGYGEGQQWLWGLDASYEHVFHPDHNFRVRAEYMGKNKEGRQGLYALTQYRFLKSWEIGYRYEYAGLEKDRTEPIIDRHSVILAALPTYFSGLRAEYTRANIHDGVKDNRFLIQLNQTIGPRRAHSY